MFAGRATLQQAARALVSSLLLSLVTAVSFTPPATAASGTISSGNCSSVVGDTTTATMIVNGDKCVIKFTSGSNSWTVPESVTAINYLVLGGGGAGSDDGGSGGGGGGAYTGLVSVSSVESATITVGAGGVRATSNNAGGYSRLTVGSRYFQGDGGAAGTTNQPSGSAGGLGGVGGGSDSTGVSHAGGNGGTGAGWSGIPGRQIGVSLNGGNGSSGSLSTAITGALVPYGGGGGGGATSTGTRGIGGTGGGGDGGYQSADATAGLTNRGGGGGGGQSAYGNRLSGNGGSGIVIISYTNPAGNFCNPTRSSVTVSGVTYSVLSLKTVGTCNWKVPPGVSSVRYLVVGGGGGGGNNRGGGGGAGGFLTGTETVTAGSLIDITVGDGGAGGVGGTGNWAQGNQNLPGNNGSDSRFGSFVAVGGGAGGASFKACTDTAGKPGGSGGGAGVFANSLAYPSIGCDGGSPTGGQGYAGGGSGRPHSVALPAGLNFDLVRNTGGGGGAGETGTAGQGGVRRSGGLSVTGVETRTPDGGDGLISNITGTAVWYAGGGGGAAGNYNYLSEYGVYYTTDYGRGGSGGGGDGSPADGVVGKAGMSNTGGGGGGGGMSQSGPTYTSYAGGDGGSGIVILRYTQTRTITFNANGGVGANETQTVADGVTTQLRLNSFTRASNLFIGWNETTTGTGKSYANAEAVTSTADLTLYAQWSTSPAYIITFDGNSNANDATNVPTSQLKTYDVMVTLTSSKPARTGYTFSGWNTRTDGQGDVYAAGAQIAGNNNNAFNLYAQWAPETYTVTYNANGADTGTVPAAATKTYGVATTLAANSGNLGKTGNKFLGWTDARTGDTFVSGATFATETNTVLNARWGANSYVLAYTANGGSPESATATLDQVKMAGETITVAVKPSSLTRAGYSFVGWNTLDTGTASSRIAPNSIETVTADTLLYAEWTPNDNTVTFKPNYTGGVAEETQTIRTGTPTMLRGNSFTRTGYTLLGWSDTATGAVLYNDLQAVTITGDLNLYAVWTTATPLTVTYDVQGGTSVNSGSTLIGGSIATSPGTPTRIGHTFNGWFSAATGGSAITFPYVHGQASNFTLYAQWTAVPTTGSGRSQAFPTCVVPRITALDKLRVSAQGGTLVTVTGSDLTSSLTIDGVSVQPVTATATAVTFTAPAHAVGAASVAIIGCGESAMTTLEYVAQPTITGISPASGPVAGGTSVLIQGQNLANATVLLNGKPLTSTARTSSSLTVVMPPHAAGKVTIEISTIGGSSTAAFTYVARTKPITARLKVYFDVQSTKISSQQLARLKVFSQQIKTWTQIRKLTVSGYVQPTPGRTGLDQKLSMKRAIAVAKILRKFGINAKANVLGMGAAKLNKATSRYVQILVTGTKG